jgi:hypothetical protein
MLESSVWENFVELPPSCQAGFYLHSVVLPIFAPLTKAIPGTTLVHATMTETVYFKGR